MEHTEIPNRISVNDLVAAVYRTATPSGPDHEQAKRAVLGANPHLRGSTEVLPGTRIALPDVGATRPTLFPSGPGMPRLDPAGVDAVLSRSDAVARVLALRHSQPLLGAAVQARLTHAENAAKAAAGTVSSIKAEHGMVAKHLEQDVKRLLAVLAGEEPPIDS